MTNLRDFLSDDQRDKFYGDSPSLDRPDHNEIDAKTYPWESSDLENDLEDPTADHLQGSEEVAPINRGARRDVAKQRITRAVRAHGPDESTASTPLAAAAIRHFGSWQKACASAGLSQNEGSSA